MKSTEMSGKTQEMGESRDPAIKLFGKTIPLRPGGEAPPVYGEDDGGDVEKGLLNKEAAHDSKDQEHGYPNSQEINEPTCADHVTPTKDNKAEELKEMSSSQEKTPTSKKPDKILPCPRCNSMDTKFCYFNNYNFNQPRHFCKKCQRYWTAGGTMRNVPVGAGRRKSKSSTANYHHITVQDVILQTVRSNAPVPIDHSPLKPNGTVLSFGSNAPLCESMSSVLSLSEKTVKNCNPNTFQRIEDQAVPLPAIEIGDEHSSSSTATASRSTDEGTGSSLQEPAICNNQGFSPQIPYFNGSPWPYSWSPPPALCSSSFSIPFYPATGFWGCTVPGTWNISWFSPIASCSNSGSSGYEADSPILGKHSREGDVLKQSNSENGYSLKQSKQEGRLWVPKTLRIDDPEEAAKSSIWASMGFQNDKADASSGGGLFRDFQAKASVKKHASASQLLHSNPAALTRSLTFQETS